MAVLAPQKVTGKAAEKFPVRQTRDRVGPVRMTPIIMSVLDSTAGLELPLSEMKVNV